jgi:glycosyltransferase involved in cell wall biosynthesis
MRILIATVQVPFVRGGAEILAEGLQTALRRAGHDAETIAIPFKWYPPERILDHMLACRLLDLTESCGNRVDQVIALKFPAYLIPHPNKVIWALHQHRTAYELWSHELGDLIRFPNGAQVRDAIQQADLNCIPEAKQVFTISANVARRLKEHCAIDSEPLYHPPRDAELFHCETAESYLFFPSRLGRTKRQALVIEALARTRHEVRVCFAGIADEASYASELHELARVRGVATRVQWLGAVTEERKRRLYARAIAVVFPPVDEDYGYVTLEAMLSSKAVITCTDSGGPLEFIRSGETGLVADPTPEALALGLDRLWDNPTLTREWGRAARREYDQREISWDNVIRRLVA